MLELHVENKVVNSSTVSVSWCLDKEIIAKIAADGRAAYMLFVYCTKEGYRQQRKLVSVTDMMTFLSFKSPGINRVFARLVIGNKHLLVDTYLAKENKHSFARTMTYSNGGALLPPMGHDELNDAVCADAQLDVEIPKEVFAKEPPHWEKNWVNRLFGSLPFDQCSYRRRRIFAYTLQPILWVLAFLYQIGLTALCILLGLRTDAAFRFRDPFDMSSQEIDGQYFWLKDDEKWGHGWREGLRVFLVIQKPIFFVIATLIAVVNHLHGIKFAGLMLFGPTALVIGFGLVVLAVGTGEYVATGLKQRKYKDKKVITAEDELSYLTCDGNPRYTIDQIPKKHRTVRLRFEAMKAKVCRPFAG